MKVTVSCPGSCGELVQGTINGRNFLVTCPVELYSRVTVTLGGGPVTPVGAKVREAVRRTLEYLGETAENVRIRVDSDLPMGKGMASSSADISAACLATALAAGREIDAKTIGDIALAIEPSDGVFLPGITLFDHVEGHTRRCLGQPPPMTAAIFDVGGEVDTIRFNQRADLAELNHLKEPQVLSALSLVEQGLQAGDCALIGAGTTLSARANQAILPKPSLEAMIETARSFGAAGINAAHSGTVLGILFDSEATGEIAGCVAAIGEKFPTVRHFRTARLVSGGLRVVEATYGG